MRASPFDRLLNGSLSTEVLWEASHRCPCPSGDGYSEGDCPICGGKGRYHDAPSTPFKVGLVGQDMKALEAMVQKFGPGAVGDAVLVLPSTAPCYSVIGSGDRIMETGVLDAHEWVVLPSSPIALPFGHVPSGAYVRSADGTQILAAPWPIAGSSGRVSVAVPTVLRFRAPRRYMVLEDLSKARAFGVGLPKRMGLKLIETTVR